MDYKKMLEEKKRLSEGTDDKSQKIMEQVIRRVIAGDWNMTPDGTKAEKAGVQTSKDKVPRIHDMMRKEFISCDEEKGILTLAFEVEEWELNPNGVMHGGLIATAMDTTCGMLVRYLSGKLGASTISLNVDYLRPVPLGDRLLVTARVLRIGRKVANLTAEAVRASDGKTADAAAAVFYLDE